VKACTLSPWRWARNTNSSELDERHDARDSAEATLDAAARLEQVSAQVAFATPVNDALLGLIEHSGFLYDSSVFPCPVYWGLKGTAIAAYRLQGRRSHSVFDTPFVLTAPTRPYRIGHPYWKRGGGLLELPIQVTRGPRLPFIGAYAVQVRSLSTCENLMKQAGIKARRHSSALIVPFPDDLGVGAWLFVENAADLPWRS